MHTVYFSQEDSLILFWRGAFVERAGLEAERTWFSSIASSFASSSEEVRSVVCLRLRIVPPVKPSKQKKQK